MDWGGQSRRNLMAHHRIMKAVREHGGLINVISSYLYYGFSVWVEKQDERARQIGPKYHLLVDSDKNRMEGIA